MTTDTTQTLQIPNLLPTELEEDLRSSVRALLADRIPFDAVAALYDAPGTDTREYDAALGTELGLAGLLVPEALGGVGATVSEAAVVAEEIGRSVAPVKFLSSAVLATSLAVRTGADELVGALASGEALAAIAFTATSSSLVSDLALGGVPEIGSEVTVSGSVPGVMEASGVDTLLVVVGTGQDTAVIAVPAENAEIHPFLTFDMSRPLADVDFHDSAGTVLATGAEAAQAVGETVLIGRTVLAAEQAGAASRAFEIALEYIKGRRQFGRTIGSYQAIKHRMADLWLEVEQAGAAATYAARTVASWQAGEESLSEAELVSLVAAAYVGPVAVHATEEAVQMHGGNGMTWEYPLHLLLKRAKQDEQILGLPEHAQAELAPLVGLTVE